jgi:hypothetical protein
VVEVAQVESPVEIASWGSTMDKLAERVEWPIPSRFSQPGL